MPTELDLINKRKKKKERQVKNRNLTSIRQQSKENKETTMLYYL
jgi:hypothetical protein